MRTRRKLLLAMGILAMPSPLVAQPRTDVRDILQLLINERPLSQYFHFATHPQRAPLRIVNESGIEFGDPSLSTGGQKATVVADGGERPLRIRSFAVDGDTAEVRFAFPAEGVSGRGRFVRRAGAWTVERVIASEH